MRTTVSIDDELLHQAKERARERGVTLGTVVEDGLRRELAGTPQQELEPLPVYHGEGGFMAGIDPTSNRSIWEALDDGLPWYKRK